MERSMRDLLRSNLKRSVSTMTINVEEEKDDLVVPHKDPSKRPNPFDLHWRSRGPKWIGNIDSAWDGKHSHLKGEIFCRYCGAIPCPLDHDDVEVSRLKDLEFVRELVKEKKELEERHQKLKEKMENLEKESEGWRGERVMLHEELKLAECRKQEWDFERTIMEAELNRLRAVNDKQLDRLESYRKDQQKIVELSIQVDRLEKENKSLKDENAKTKDLLRSTIDDAEHYEKQNKTLKYELVEAQNIIEALKTQIDGFHEERQKYKKEIADRDSRIKQTEDDMKKLIKDLESQLKVHTEKENLSKALMEQLRNHVLELKTRLDESEKYGADLEDQINAYLQEIEKLRNRLSSDKRFRKFVEIKRECNELKNRNEALLSQSQLGLTNSIPFLNAAGRVVSPSGRSCSSMLQMRRTKSASTFVSTEKLYSVKKVKDTLKLDNL